MSDAPDWVLRAYRPGDEARLVALFERAFGRSLTEPQWRWKLKPARGSIENVWLAEAADRPVFQYAGIPVRIRLPGGPRVAMVSVDTMSDPTYQRRGLLTEVGKQTYARWKEDGVAFVLGLPNERWGSRAQALGWIPLFDLRWYVRPLQPSAIVADRLRSPRIPGSSAIDTLANAAISAANPRDTTVTIRPIDDPGFFDGVVQTGHISIIRDGARVGWRYLDPPDLDYRVIGAQRAGAPVGYCAYRLRQAQGRTTGVIAELAAGHDAQARRALLAHAVDAFIGEDARTARALAVPGSDLAWSLIRAGFVPKRAAFGVQIVPLADDLPLESLRNPACWDLQGGDFDVV